MEENGKLIGKIKLSQIFNVFNSKLTVHFGAVLLGVALLIIGVFKLPAILLSILFGIIGTYIVAVQSPKEIEIYDEYLKFSDYVHMRPGAYAKRGFWWLRVDYTVREVELIHFEQNAIEKYFGIWHVTFSGDAVFNAKRDLERIPAKSVFTIYGVKDIDDFKNKIESMKK